jgi:four helix bundle protein
VNAKANATAERLKRFAARVVTFARAMPKGSSVDAIARQLTKSGTSEAANFHAARRARSRDEFIAELAVAAEEAEETENCFRLITDTHIVSTAQGLRELDSSNP